MNKIEIFLLNKITKIPAYCANDFSFEKYIKINERIHTQ